MRTLNRVLGGFNIIMVFDTKLKNREEVTNDISSQQIKALPYTLKPPVQLRCHFLCTVTKKMNELNFYFRAVLIILDL